MYKCIGKYSNCTGIAMDCYGIAVAVSVSGIAARAEDLVLPPLLPLLHSTAIPMHLLYCPIHFAIICYILTVFYFLYFPDAHDF